MKTAGALILFLAFAIAMSIAGIIFAVGGAVRDAATD